MIVKSGYKTSEFWFTLVSFVFSGLYLAGILKENDKKEELITIVSHAVESTILISGQVLILYKYIKGRTEVKKIYATEKNKNEEEINVSKRTNNSGSRKVNRTNKNIGKKSKKNSAK